jgi:hypothetical protein
MADIVTGYSFTDGEKGITSTKLNNVISAAVIQPDFVFNKPASPTLDPTDQLLELKSNNTYARITGSQLVSSVSSQVDITSQFGGLRLRSFNAIGNPNFEVDQRNAGTAVNPVINANTFLVDRWMVAMVGSTMRTSGGQASATTIVVPGTNFLITGKYVNLNLTAQQATLAAGDALTFTHYVEGNTARELLNDVHSLSLLVQSSVANLKFGVAIINGATNQSLCKLCTSGAANTWTLITLPNLPVFPSGSVNINPGVNGYQLRITLAAGTSFIPPANDTWQNGNFLGAIGQANFAASSVGSTFSIAFIQHEPGPCTTLQDKPFTTNFDECSRYYSKTYDIGTTPGTATSNGITALYNISATGAMSFGARLRKTMAKIPTVTIYDHNNGAVNSIMDSAAVHHAVSGVIGNSTEVPFYQVTTSGLTVASNCWCHYTADTGW